MSNIINHYLITFGSAAEINRLKTDLSQPVTAYKLLNSDSAKLYVGLAFRPADHPSFGKSGAMLWDFAQGYHEAEIVSEKLATIAPELDTMTEFILTNRPAEDVAVFVFQSKYSPAIEGLFRVSANYPTLNFRIFCNGSFINRDIEAIEIGLLAGQEQYCEIYNKENLTARKQVA